jgi:hypothetical protein
MELTRGSNQALLPLRGIPLLNLEKSNWKEATPAKSPCATPLPQREAITITSPKPTLSAPSPAVERVSLPLAEGTKKNHEQPKLTAIEPIPYNQAAPSDTIAFPTIQPKATSLKSSSKKFYLSATITTPPAANLDPVSQFLKLSKPPASLQWIERTPTTQQIRLLQAQKTQNHPPAHIILLLPEPDDSTLLAVINRFLLAISNSLNTHSSKNNLSLQWIKTTFEELSPEKLQHLKTGITEHITRLIIAPSEVLSSLYLYLYPEDQKLKHRPLPKKLEATLCFPFTCDDALLSPDTKQLIWSELHPLLQTICAGS